MSKTPRVRIFVTRAFAFVVVLALFAAVVIGVRALSDNHANETDSSGGRPGGGTVPVEVVTVERRDLRDTVRGIGTLRASRTVHLSPEIDGTLRAIHFREGELVEEGDLLFELDDRKLVQSRQIQQSALRSARARLDIARTTFERVQRLREQNVASADEYDRARTDLDAAMSDVEQFEANLSLVEEELSDTRFHASFSGVVSERLIDEGNYVQVGQRIATLHQANPLEMSFGLPERYLDRVAIGQSVEVLVASYPDERFDGIVSFISPTVNEQTRDFLVKAEIDNEDLRLRPGSFGTAVVVIGERAERPVVPEEALVPTRTGHSVFVIDDEQRASLQRVSIGLRTNGMVEITEGLEGGETIVHVGQLRLNDGGKVEIVSD